MPPSGLAADSVRYGHPDLLRTGVDPDTFHQEWLGVPSSDDDFSCIAKLNGDVVAIGFLNIVDGIGQPGMPELTEGVIGYVVDPEFAGRGLATHVAAGLVRAAFEHVELHRVTAGCNADNPASARVLEKAAVRRETHGVEDSWHAKLGWVDDDQYAILAREWRARHGRPSQQP